MPNRAHFSISPGNAARCIATRTFMSAARSVGRQGWARQTERAAPSSACSLLHGDRPLPSRASESSHPDRKSPRVCSPPRRAGEAARLGRVAETPGHRGRDAQIGSSPCGSPRPGWAGSSAATPPPRCTRIRSMTAGSSMLAITRSRPPQRRHVVISIANTRSNRMAELSVQPFDRHWNAT